MGSKLQSLVLRAPGMYGLNFEGETYQEAPVFAEVAENIAYDSAGRLTNRKGFDVLTNGHANALGYESLGSNPITTVTTAGLTGRITIADTSHGQSTGDFVTISGAADTNGITAAQINTRFSITVVDANSYYVYTAGTATSASAAGGAGVKVKYEPKVDTLFMYNYSGGQRLLSVSAYGGNNIYEDTASFDNFTSVKGSVTIANTRPQFVNFNDKVIATNEGTALIVKSGTGNFAAVPATSGTVPTGRLVHSAFGRVWAQKSHTGTSQNIIAYSVFLEEDKWDTGAGAGEITVLGNFAAVKDGFDELVAISSFDQYLVAFLRNSIVIYNNPHTPASLGIQQIIQGVGCIARDSIQSIGKDLYFMSATGIRSLRQVIYTGDRADLNEISTLVRREFLVDVAASESALVNVRSSYDPEEGQYWLKAPEGNIWVFDMHTLDQNVPIRITKYVDTKWDSFVYFEGETYIGSRGMIGKYNGFVDDSPSASTSYTCTWRSNPADLGTSKLKMLKKVTATVEGASTSDTVNVTYAFAEGGSGEVPFTLSSNNAFNRSSGLAVGTVAEWGVANWNVDEWGGGSASAYNLAAPISQSGRTFKLGVRFVSNGFQIAVEQLSLFMKLGREGR
jgi:hypothetical protein